MEVVSNGGGDFRDLAARFKAAGKDGAAIRRATTRAIRRELGVIQREIQRGVLGMQAKGIYGRGTVRREGFIAARVLRGRRPGRVAPHNLRAAVARSVRIRVAYSGRRLGARIWIDTSGLPRSQQRLPAHLNDPRGWRHPVWGNRKKWVRQVGEPHYFDRPILRHRDQVARNVKAAVDDVLRRLR